jgi:argininosuccinate synthase
MWRWTVSPEDAPDKAEYVELSYKKGDIVAINGKTMSPASVMALAQTKNRYKPYWHILASVHL